MEKIDCILYFEDLVLSRKKLFEVALQGAKRGRVLYILFEELTELPQLSQELNSLNTHYMKMISFLYVKTLDVLIESVSTLPDWRNVPATIILDDLSAYCDKNNLQNACGVVALLLDTARCCAVSLKTLCELHISMPRQGVGEEYCKVVKEFYHKPFLFK